MGLIDDPIQWRAHQARQHREHTDAVQRHKDQQTVDQQLMLLESAIVTAIRHAPDVFRGLDPRRAAELIVRELL